MEIQIDRQIGKASLVERVHQFASHISEYTHQSYNETEVRVDFVNPFFKALGWDVDNEGGLPQHLREVTHEATVKVDENGNLRSKKPDYSFRVGTETFFYLETKKPSVDITNDCAPAFQLRRYGWSGNLKISVLTNFADLYIYDCSVRPVETDGIGVALIAHYSYKEYEEKFEEIYGLLSKEAVLTGEFSNCFENLHRSFRCEPFDEFFLKQIKNWRLELGRSIWQFSSSISVETLNISVQRILNRIIFLRICEDRSFERYETLKQIQTYEELKDLFVNADRKYDSGLFAVLEEDRFTVADDVILNIFRNLYYPNNSYEFSVVDPFIIGQIYELFLAEKLVVGVNGEIVAEPKPEAVDSQGVVNTPKNITDIIVEQSLSTVFEGKTPAELQKIRIADICCGSGNFLLSAFEYTVNYCVGWYINNELEKALRDGILIANLGGDSYQLSYAVRRNILLHNIWGVDIDPLAVEVTKFSLFLKLLEKTNRDELDAFTQSSSKCVLPKMDKNIKNGNSLVGPEYAQYDSEVFFRPDGLKQIRMFDWMAEFGKGVFDAIIGNPPYIRVQNMVHYSPKEYGFYKDYRSGCLTAGASLLDKYYLFIERAWNLLKPDGIIGYIVPHKFMNIASGRELRGFLANQGAIRKIIHFGTHQAFKNRSTYTCILILRKQTQKFYEIAFVQDWNRFLFEHKIEFECYSSDTLSENPWTYIPKPIKESIERLGNTCSSLQDLAHVFVGVQTSNDKVYIITADAEDEKYVYFRDKNRSNRKIEKGILRKSIYDIQLKKYQRIIPNTYIVFPYHDLDGRARLIEVDSMKSNYPYAYDYLISFKDELDRRNMVPARTPQNWYAYGRSQSLSRFIAGEHLIWPVLSTDSNYVYDDSLAVFTGGGNGPFYGIEMKDSTKESIFYVQAILNHWLMELIVKNSASTFQGDYYSHGKQFIADLPIYRIDFLDEKQTRIHEEIVNKVHLIEDLFTQITEAQSSVEKRTYERAIETTEKELSALIDSLYGVTGMQVEESNENN